uniref:Uncharacterized protein n=1 Tax=Anopheles atroparvus TaxID=41427 RepID=A0AAG5CWX5_ANOAO
MPTEYFANESKKLTHFQPDLTQNTVPINYEYPLTAAHRQHHQHSQPHLTSHPRHHQSSLHHQHPHGVGLQHLQNQSSQQPPTLPIGGLKSSVPLPRSNSEHHYDVPHLCK